MLRMPTKKLQLWTPIVTSNLKVFTGTSDGYTWLYMKKHPNKLEFKVKISAKTAQET